MIVEGLTPSFWAKAFWVYIPRCSMEILILIRCIDSLRQKNCLGQCPYCA